MSNDFDPRCHIGETHGIYTIVDMTGEKDKYGHWIYKCVCSECGHEKLSHYGAISGEKSKATTCRHLRANGEPIVNRCFWDNNRLSNTFYNMIGRCYNSSNKDYKWYGEKGIKIYAEWLNNPKEFEIWAMNNGYADNLTIDRIDVNKDYCPENCRWITVEENSRRAGSVNWITVGDKTLTGKQWAQNFCIGINTINNMARKHGVDKVKELIVAMLEKPPATTHRKPNQSWFSAYGIQV